MNARRNVVAVCLGILMVVQGCAQVLGLDEERVFTVGTGGGGGAGGGGGSGGSSGTSCQVPTDCPDLNDSCKTRACTDHACGWTFAGKGTVCAQDHECDEIGACKKSLGVVCASADECASAACVDNFCCTELCNGECQACSAEKKGQGENGICSAIKENLDPDDECANGECNGKKSCIYGTGASCASNGECKSGFCVDGVCCENACTDRCSSCAVTGYVGTCVYTPAGEDDANGIPVCTEGNTCDGAGACKKENGQSCSANADCFSASCAAGICSGPSCTGLPATCGPNNENCCLSSVVQGGMFNRGNDMMYPATVSDFRLDRFEITVGRFRKFVEAYPGSKPAADAGAHPLIMGSGWNSAWDTNLPMDQAALKDDVKCQASFQTWTDAPGANENLPMNCISWYVSFAFCAWDGGRLPTEAEWNYAAAGGNEQRQYPWGDTAPDATYAVYGCNGSGSMYDCVLSDILKVGSKSSKGDARWSQADLGGSMWEWNLDWYDNYTIDCNNCANILNGPYRVMRGGGWGTKAPFLLSSGRGYDTPMGRDSNAGARCARTL